MPTNTPSGYINGSDLLVKFGSAATGHATSHSLSFSTETKDVAVKPASTQPLSTASLFKSKRITGLGVQIKASGLSVYSETESDVSDFLGAWKVGSSVSAAAFSRGNDATPYVSGNFIITSIEVSAPAGEDATYDITLDNDGAVSIAEAKFEPSPASSGGSGGDS